MAELAEEVKNRIFNAPPSIPKRRQDALKFNGWGYNDAKFGVTKDKNIIFSGSNYDVISGHVLPNFVGWMKRTMDIDVEGGLENVPIEKVWCDNDVQSEVKDNDLLNEMKTKGFDLSIDVSDRVFRGHGHTMSEVFDLRRGVFPRVPDLVVWPKNHNEVVDIVAIVAKHGGVLIPFGGGTSVTGALICPENERRCIVSLDTSQMNKIIWLDETNMTVRMEAGIIGQDMEKRLALLGFCVGHEPDSFEFSSLGGWVATRASGMKKNIYGNIEDIVVHVTMVTPQGVLQKDSQVPRVSLGPDVHHFILGSEGTLGVITEVTLKVRRLPKVKKYGSIIFPDLESGFNCLREVARQRIFPASIRLMDNEQFHFGLALKSPASSVFSRFLDGLKRLYLLSYKGFDPNRLCVATLLMEGDSRQAVAAQERSLLSIARAHRGLSGGEENGKRGYLLTFVIAYIRDLAMDHCVVAESFETSVPWDKALDLCAGVKETVVKEAGRLGVLKPVFVTCRITQIYDAGVCVYFYLALNYAGVKADPVHLYEEVEAAARDRILELGGSLSHHHGVGKVRSRWLERVISPAGLRGLRAVKDALDPGNMFANGALFDARLPARL